MAYDLNKSRPKMPIADRAKQFMPFAAVKGLDEALAKKESELQFEKKSLLSEEESARIDRKLRKLQPGDPIVIRAYSEEGKRYLDYTGVVAGVDFVYRTVAVGSRVIRMDDILQIQTNL